MHHLLLLLAAAGLLAGAMNAIAGGGSFVTFPAMVFAGLPPVIANASSTVALFPGTLASTWAYRRELAGTGDIRLRWMLPVSIAGGLCGALLLLFTPAHLFDLVIPWLLLLATLTFAFGARAGAALRRVVRIGPATLLAVQFVISLYGGYFGGAVGLMMLAAWGLLTASVNVKAMAPGAHAAGQCGERRGGAAVHRLGRGALAGDAGVAGRRGRRRLRRRARGAPVAAGAGARRRAAADRDDHGGVLPAGVLTDAPVVRLPPPRHCEARNDEAIPRAARSRTGLVRRRRMLRPAALLAMTGMAPNDMLV